MHSVEEIETAITNLSPEEIVQLRNWFEEYCEGQLQLKDEVIVQIEKAKTEIKAGDCRIPSRQH